MVEIRVIPPEEINIYEIAEIGLTSLMILGGISLINSNSTAGIALVLPGIVLGAIQLFEWEIIKL